MTMKAKAKTRAKTTTTNTTTGPKVAKPASPPKFQAPAPSRPPRVTSLTLGGLVALLADRHGLSRKVSRAIVDEVIDQIGIALTDGSGSARLVGLGSFRVMERPARTTRNPRTGEAIAVPARKVVRFRAAKDLAERLNGEGGGR